MAKLPSPHRVVILGAGIGGLRTALELEKRCARMKLCEIVLIDRYACHEYHPLLYEVCTGALEDARSGSVGALRAGVCVSLDKYVSILRRKHIRFLRGEITGLDRETKEVLLNDGARVPYDDVVVSVGASSATYGIPGVAEYALPLKHVDDALKIRERIARFLAAYERGEEKRLAIVVGGAGATGTEFAAELGNFFARLVRNGVLKTGDYDIRLVEAGPAILNMLPESLRKKAAARLTALGVTVMTSTKMLSVESTSAVRLLGADGAESTYEADVVVWTGGIKPAEVIATLGFPLDEKGYIQVDPTFGIKGVEHAYALGDAASFLHPKTGKRVPPLGQAAVKESAYVAENIVRHLERHGPMSWVPPERWVTVVPLGGKFAIADFGSWHLSGILGYAVRKAADFLYFFSILPARTAWKVWALGASVYTKND